MCSSDLGGEVGWPGPDSGKKHGVAPEPQGKGKDEEGEKIAEGIREDAPEVRLERKEPSLEAAAGQRSGGVSRA